MKKNTLALNIGEEALIEGFGVIRCIKSYKDCNSCCLHNKCIEYNNYNLVPCYPSLRKHLNLDNENIIFVRVTAVVKSKNN